MSSIPLSITLHTSSESPITSPYYPHTDPVDIQALTTKCDCSLCNCNPCMCGSANITFVNPSITNSNDSKESTESLNTTEFSETQTLLDNSRLQTVYVYRRYLPSYTRNIMNGVIIGLAQISALTVVGFYFGFGFRLGSTTAKGYLSK